MKLRVYVAGNNGIGRASLIRAYIKGKCEKTESSEYLFVTQHKNVIINKKKVEMEISLDESAENILENRLYSYNMADVIIFCFSLVEKHSYQALQKAYDQEISKYCKDKPYILVSLKKDIRDGLNAGSNYDNDKFETIEGEQLKEKINAKYYIECSAWENENVNEVFETAARLFLNKNKNERKNKHKSNDKTQKTNRKNHCNLS